MQINLIGIYTILFSMTACLQGQGILEQDAGAGKAVLVESSSDPDGVITGSFKAGSSITQSLQGSGDVSNMSVSFPPGALNIDVDISLQEGANLASNSISEKLNMTSSGAINAAGKSLVIKADKSIKADKPFTIQIPVSSAAGLNLASSFANLIMIYKVDKADGSFYIGIITGDKIKIVNGIAFFETEYFGSYQPAISENKITEAKEAVSETPILTKVEEKKLDPVVWTLNNPVFNPTTRKTSFTAAHTGFAEIVSCGIFVSNAASEGLLYSAKINSLKDVVYPADDTLGAYSAYAQFECEDKIGRIERSQKSKVLSIPEKVNAIPSVYVSGFPDAATSPYLGTSVTYLYGTVLGDRSQFYRYAFGKNINCNNKALYGAETPVTAPLMISELSSAPQGNFTICLIGRDNSTLNWQTNPTVIQYTKDTISPSAVSLGSSPVTANASFTRTATAMDTSPVTYTWSVASGDASSVSFSNASSATTSIIGNWDTSVTIRVTATDAAGNTNYADLTLTWDTLGPGCIISSSNNVGVGTTGGLQTTFNGNFYEPAIITYSLFANSSNMYYDGDGFDSEMPVFLSVASATQPDFTINIPDSILSSASEFELQVKTVDAAGNVGGCVLSNITWDTSPPSVTISQSGDLDENSYAGLYQVISGTASDAAAIDAVLFSIEDTSTSKWYNGTAFISDTEAWLDPTGSTSWEFLIPDENLTVGHFYQIRAKANDIHNNDSSIVSSTFYWTNPDTISPTLVGGATLNTSTSHANGFLLSWTQANDNVTPTNSLQYSVYKSTTDNISTLANIINNGTLVGSVMGASSFDVTNTQGPIYYYNVVVQDLAENQELYTTISYQIPDSSPPTIAADGLIVFTKDENNLRLSFSKSSDNFSPQNTLIYEVRTSSSSDPMITVADADSFGALVGIPQMDVDYIDVPYTPDSQGFYTVMVKDAAENRSIYQTRKVFTDSTGSVVGTSNGPSANRKTFYDQDHSIHWMFWFDGSNVMAAYSTDGIVWVDCGIQTPANSDKFSVAYKNHGGNSYALLAYESGPYSVDVRKLSLTSNTITSDSIQNWYVGDSPTNQYRKPNIAIDSDGVPWLAAVKISSAQAQERAIVSKNAHAVNVSGWSVTSQKFVGEAQQIIKDLILLPESEANKINLLVNSEAIQMYRSIDGGTAWSENSGSSNLTWKQTLPGFFGSSSIIRAIAVAGSEVYIGGTFTISVGGPSHLAKWNGSEWVGIGDLSITGPVYAIEVDGTDLIVGGSFSSVGGTDKTAGIARWSSSSGWSSVCGVAISGAVNAIKSVGGNTYFGGDFSFGSPTINGLAKVSDGTCSGVGRGVAAGGAVNALALNDDYLYVGGTFNNAVNGTGGIIANTDKLFKVNVANDQVFALSEDFPGGGAINALAHDGVNLYVGGDSLSPHTFSKFDGSSWTNAGNFTGTIRAIYFDGSMIYVGGSFIINSEHAFGSTSSNTKNFARYSASQFSHVDGGVPASAEVHAITLGLGNRVFAGGYNTSATKAFYSISMPTIMDSAHSMSAVLDNNDEIHVVGIGGPSQEVLYSKFSGGWTVPTQIGPSSSTSPVIAIYPNSNDLAVLWISDGSSIYLNRTDAPNTWSGQSALLGSSGIAGLAADAVSSSPENIIKVTYVESGTTVKTMVVSPALP